MEYLVAGHDHLYCAPTPGGPIIRDSSGECLVAESSDRVRFWVNMGGRGKLSWFQLTSMQIDEFGLGAEVCQVGNILRRVRWDFAAGKLVES